MEITHCQACKNKFKNYNDKYLLKKKSTWEFKMFLCSRCDDGEWVNYCPDEVSDEEW